jgi:hypothetical protein
MAEDQNGSPNKTRRPLRLRNQLFGFEGPFRVVFASRPGPPKLNDLESSCSPPPLIPGSEVEVKPRRQSRARQLQREAFRWPPKRVSLVGQSTARLLGTPPIEILGFKLMIVDRNRNSSAAAVQAKIPASKPPRRTAFERIFFMLKETLFIEIS